MGMRILFWVFVLSGLTSCVTYHALPLDTSKPLMDATTSLKTNIPTELTSTLPQTWQQYPIDMHNGLDEVELSILVLLNNPQLLASRVQLSEAQATLKQAGLLADPQLGITWDIPKSTGLVSGRNFSLGFNLQRLIMRGALQSIAIQQAKSVYLNVLWQQWQVIQQARMLWHRSWVEQEKIHVFQRQVLQTQQLWQRQHQALQQGNVTLDQHALAANAVTDAKIAHLEEQRQHNITQHALSLMLGLNPNVAIVLQTPTQYLHNFIQEPISDEALQPMLSQLGQTRPDLLALQAGYQSQEASVRASILAQFPSFSIGMNRSRDTAGVWSFGPWINLNLPMFDGNRGQIEFEQASRQRLHREYRMQHASTQVQIQQMIADQRLAYIEWKLLLKQQPPLEKTVENMANALAEGQMDMLTFINLKTALFNQQARTLVLEKTLLEQSVALETLLGTWLTQTNIEVKK